MPRFAHRVSPNTAIVFRLLLLKGLIAAIAVTLSLSFFESPSARGRIHKSFGAANTSLPLSSGSGETLQLT